MFKKKKQIELTEEQKEIRLYFKFCVNTEERHKIKIGCRCVRRSAAYTP